MLGRERKPSISQNGDRSTARPASRIRRPFLYGNSPARKKTLLNPEWFRSRAANKRRTLKTSTPDWPSWSVATKAQRFITMSKSIRATSCPTVQLPAQERPGRTCPANTSAEKSRPFRPSFTTDTKTSTADSFRFKPSVTLLQRRQDTEVSYRKIKETKITMIEIPIEKVSSPAADREKCKSTILQNTPDVLQCRISEVADFFYQIIDFLTMFGDLVGQFNLGVIAHNVLLSDEGVVGEVKRHHSTPFIRRRQF